MAIAPTDLEPAKRNASPLSLTVIILTRDEARHLPRALASIREIAERVVVVDSGSTDGTLAIAREAGASIHERAWVNHAEQFQWALDNAAITTQWVMRLDADEWLGEDCIANLRAMLPELPADVAGVSLDRRHYFMGRWIRHGGRNPLRLLRIWRHRQARIEQRWMDEHIVLTQGRITHCRGSFADQNLGSLSEFTRKHDGYATREAVDVLLDAYGMHPESAGKLNSTTQASTKRTLKQRVYNRLPLGLGPLVYFLYRYLFQLGFLDGRAGLIYHVLQGFWYRFLVDAKLSELRQLLENRAPETDIIDSIELATGLDIRGFQSGATGAMIHE